ncbi:hypothetical protein GCM10009560_05790 [Nonomuraea longicatena]|uniref:Uncharacterized protein n=1 Tax=Nonomuraea longicatena TaxID=83682 RepID=A0ABP3Z289_9ACTN
MGAGVGTWSSRVGAGRVLSGDSGVLSRGRSGRIGVGGCRMGARSAGMRARGARMRARASGGGARSGGLRTRTGRVGACDRGLRACGGGLRPGDGGLRAGGRAAAGCSGIGLGRVGLGRAGPAGKSGLARKDGLSLVRGGLAALAGLTLLPGMLAGMLAGLRCVRALLGARPGGARGSRGALLRSGGQALLRPSCGARSSRLRGDDGQRAVRADRHLGEDLTEERPDHRLRRNGGDGQVARTQSPQPVPPAEAGDRRPGRFRPSGQRRVDVVDRQRRKHVAQRKVVPADGGQPGEAFAQPVESGRAERAR